MNLFRTRNQGLCALLRYLHGRHTHVRTYLEDSGSVTFELTDPNGEARGIARTYHGDSGGGGFGIADAKSLIDDFIAVRKTLTAALDFGEWRNTNE